MLALEERNGDLELRYGVRAARVVRLGIVVLDRNVPGYADGALVRVDVIHDVGLDVDEVVFGKHGVRLTAPRKGQQRQ